MGRRRPVEAPADRPAVLLEGARDGPQGREAALGASDTEVGGRASCAPPPSRPAGAVRPGRLGTDAAPGAGARRPRGAARRPAKRRGPRAAPYVLLASGDAWRRGSGDSGIGRPSGPVD